MMYTISRQLTFFLLASIAVLFFCLRFFNVYQVRENSMEPLLLNGQKIIAVRNRTLHRGDIVVFENPEDNRLVVKRFLLSPGDPVTIRNGILITPDGNVPLTVRQSHLLSNLEFIPDNMFFALGDNIFNSHDSRDYGPVTINNIKGKVLLF
ncbi:signal peptidase I [Spirochaeta isovalerica]|uniref:Signal peptidase I n=1 Tax=Spirochaeta isovalerica TaxID=150 RepID=A0A841R7E8_9SPIO|nr:signal peptidase I [Spirochaeta isovalerica]MBB6478668.1 signal peptidase I [Spirochaeta isovalerica]